MTCVLSTRPQERIFFLRIETAALSFSINVPVYAPRLNASIPNAPVPAKRSRTIAPRTRSDKILKIASLNRSPVGRIFFPGIDWSLRPLCVPLMILKGIPGPELSDFYPDLHPFHAIPARAGIHQDFATPLCKKSLSSDGSELFNFFIQITPFDTNFLSSFRDIVAILQ